MQCPREPVEQEPQSSLTGGECTNRSETGPKSMVAMAHPWRCSRGNTLRKIDQFDLYPANQYVTSRGKLATAITGIKAELEERVAFFEKNQQYLEAQRIRMRTNYDLEMLQEMGFCSGIENYSAHLTGRKRGDRPFCLIDFFAKDFLTLVDESHVTLPQIGGMYNGDLARKGTLVNFGFRLPSALDNRPQSFAEFQQVTGQTLYVSATPAKFELERSTVIAEQLIRQGGDGQIGRAHV